MKCNCVIVLCKYNARNVNYNVISSAFYHYLLLWSVCWLIVLGSHIFAMEIYRIMFLINIKII